MARAEVHALRERIDRRAAAASDGEDAAVPTESGEMRVRAVMVLVGGGITRDTAARLLLHCNGDVQSAVRPLLLSHSHTYTYTIQLLCHA